MARTLASKALPAAVLPPKGTSLLSLFSFLPVQLIRAVCRIVSDIRAVSATWAAWVANVRLRALQFLRGAPTACGSLPISGCPDRTGHELIAEAACISRDTRK